MLAKRYLALFILSVVVIIEGIDYKTWIEGILKAQGARIRRQSGWLKRMYREMKSQKAPKTARVLEAETDK